MDNARCHPPEALQALHENIRVVFLPANTTPLIQPMDQEVIFSLKSTLKLKYFNRLLTFVRAHWHEDGDLYRRFLRQHTFLESIQDLCAAWRQVPQPTIKMSFNNLLKKKDLYDELRQEHDFDGFGPDITDPDVTSFDIVTQEDQQRRQTEVVANLTQTFNQLSNDNIDSVGRTRIFVTTDNDIIDDLDMDQEVPEDIIADYIENTIIHLNPEPDLAADMAEDEEYTLKDQMDTLQAQIGSLQASVRHYITKSSVKSGALKGLRALSQTFRQQDKQNRNPTTPNVATETVDTMPEHEGE